MLKVGVRAMDGARQPIAGVEVWRIDTPVLDPPEPTRAVLLGVTAADGRLAVFDCYLGTAEFSEWNPEQAPVKYELMIVRDGYGVKHVVFTPPASDVLGAGNLVGLPPGTAIPSRHQFPPARRDRAYVVSAEVVLAMAR